jgi:hypothetical protein
MPEKIETVKAHQGGPNKANLRVLTYSLALSIAASAIFLVIFMA